MFRPLGGQQFGAAHLVGVFSGDRGDQQLVGASDSGECGQLLDDGGRRADGRNAAR
jgi:hypothetical protein